MAQFPIYNPVAEDAISPPIGGMTNALALLSGTLGLGKSNVANETMTELYIDDSDRHRIYVVDVNKRGWLEVPSPVIKKNGAIITPVTEGFEINYMGGSIEFLNETLRPTESDIITADFSYVNGNSEVISGIDDKISSLIGKTSNYRGSFDTLESLKSGVVNPLKYDYAFVFGTVSDIYFYDSSSSDWVSVTANDVSELKQQIKNLQDGKEDKIATKGTAFNKDFGTENENVMRGDYAYSKHEVDVKFDEKENSIGNKGSAFNKDFGTVVGTVADGEYVAPIYTEATSLTNLTSGETTKVAFAKMKKWYTDAISKVGGLLIKVGTATLETTNKNLSGAVNELNGDILYTHDLAQKYRKQMDLFYKYITFTNNPADFLGEGFTFSTVINDNGDTYAPVTSAVPMWWNVLTFGDRSRCTQIATQVYAGRSYTNKIYVRSRHDADTSAWREIGSQ